MTSADLLVERGAEGLHRLAGRAAARGDGVGTWLAKELEADAKFLRKLKPSLISARVRANGAAPADPPPPPSAPADPEPPTVASGTEPPAAPPKRDRRRSARMVIARGGRSLDSTIWPPDS